MLMACGVFGAVSLIAAAASPIRRDAQAAAALFPPWWSAAAAFAAAGTAGAVVRTGALSTIVVVRSDEPGLPRRLEGAGAILILDPQALGLCGQAGKQGKSDG